MRLGTCAAAVVAFAGCWTSDPLPHGGAGTLVYSARDTEEIRILDVATGEERLVDGDALGSMTIAPDGEHVAYIGGDGWLHVNVVDRTGQVVASQPREACTTTGAWLSPTALVYCASTTRDEDARLLPALDAVPRRVPANATFSVDGAYVAYVAKTGDVIVERLDGSESRVVLPSADPTAMRSGRYIETFSPDSRILIIADVSTDPDTLVVVSLVDGTRHTLDGAQMFHHYVYEQPHLEDPMDHAPWTGFMGGSAFSADSAEVLIQSSANLEVFDVASGTRQPIAAYSPRMFSSGAAFLPDGRVVWVRIDDMTTGDLIQLEISLRITSPGTGDDVELATGYPRVVVILPTTILFDVVDNILGVLPDGSGVITSNGNEVELVGLDGSTRTLALVSIPWPSAAYAPR